MRIHVLSAGSDSPYNAVHQHSLVLARHWRAAGHEVRIDAFDSLPGPRPGRAAAWVDAHARSGEATSGARPVLYVQYANYGISGNGDPRPLLDALRRNRDRLRTAVYVHEAFHRTARPSRTALVWRRHRSTAAAVARVADVAFTNCEYWAQPLGLPAEAVVPVFSNVGEPDRVDGTDRRTAVVMGRPSTRAAVYADRRLHADALAGVESVVDIGADDVAPTTWLGRPVTALGRLPDAELSARLGRALTGFTDTDEFRLTKSSVYAALAAHGVGTYVLGRQGTTYDTGLVAGRDYLLPGRAFDARVGVNAWNRYRRNSSEVAAARILAALDRAAVDQRRG